MKKNTEAMYEDYNLVVKKLMHICFEREWTQTRLAKEMDLTICMVNRILNLKCVPTPWTLTKLQWFIDKVEKGE